MGFGFSRYSTDQKWLAPHFEKMLYDNALLAVVYSETFLITKDTFYRQAAEEIFQYVLRDLSSPEGAFFSAEDADSEGEEGKFYTFTKSEILSLLGKADGEKFCGEYGISLAGNFEGRNILNLINNENYREIILDSFYTDCLNKLYEYRQKRIRPLVDKKVLSSWNGLMIYALAYAGRTFGERSYIQKAKASADFILKNMLDNNGKLLTRYCDGEACFQGVAEDYAFVVMGLIELYQATFSVRYLKEAYRLNQILIDNFFEESALYQTGNDAEPLISRPRELYDGAIPSYNSVSIVNFVKLAHLCDNPMLIDKARDIVRFFGASIESSPIQFGFALCGMMLLNGFSKQIIVAGVNNSEVIDIINSSYQPFAALCLANEELARTINFYNNFIEIKENSAVYLCENSHCEAPIHNPDQLRKRLGSNKSHELNLGE